MTTTTFVWTAGLAIDHGTIDEQHQHLFGLANMAMSVDLPHSQIGIVRQVMAGLLDYTRYHFDDEERIMLETRYPGLAEHRNQHEDILRQMKCLLLGTRQANQLAVKLQATVKTWIYDHVLEHDLLFKAWLAESSPTMHQAHAS